MIKLIGADLHTWCTSGFLSAILIPLGSYWDPIGILLGSYWDPIGILLGSYWDPIGILLGSYWDSLRGFFWAILYDPDGNETMHWNSGP